MGRRSRRRAREAAERATIWHVAEDDATPDENSHHGSHDYDPSWDYEVLDTQYDHPLVQRAQQIAAQHWPGAEIHPANLAHEGVAAKYIDGTYSRPIIVFDPFVHEKAAPEEVENTVRHELQHAHQERRGDGYDEGDAEHGWREGSVAQPEKAHHGAALPSPPPRPGELPIPEGTLRFFHYTHPDNLDSVRQQGLLYSRGRGDSGTGIDEPSKGVWASNHAPDDEALQHKPYVEFYLHPEQVSQNAEHFWHRDPHEWNNDGRLHHIIAKGDVPPEQIVAIHEPWHMGARYIAENGGPEQYQWIRDHPADDPTYGPYIKSLDYLEGRQSSATPPEKERYGSSEPRVLYHTSPMTNREDIRALGLRPGGLGTEHSITEEIGNDPGVYALADPAAFGDGGVWPHTPRYHDIWAFDTDGLYIEPDPASGMGGSWLTPDEVPPGRLRLHHEAPGDATPENGHPVNPPHVAGRTINQELRDWNDLQSLYAELAEDDDESDYSVDDPHPVTLHNFPDGWTVQHHPSQASAQMVGGFMRNCWQGRDVAWQAAPSPYRGQFAALHDEHGLPRAAFYWHPQRRIITQPLGMRNDPLTPDLAGRLEQFKNGELNRATPESGHYGAEGRPEALPMENGLYYRAHRPDQPFGRAHAQTAPIWTPEGEEWEKFRVPKPGYSAFWNPHHVHEYMEHMRWDPERDGRNVIAFRGTPIGEGSDGEPRVMPLSDDIEFSMPWSEFALRADWTSNGYGRWDEHTWGDGPDGAQADDGYRTIFDIGKEGSATPPANEPYESKTAMAERSGFPELDRAIEEFMAAHPHVQDYRDPRNAWGACDASAGELAAFLKQRGFDAYATHDEIGAFEGYEHAQDSATIGAGSFSYPEHAMVEVYGLPGVGVLTVTIDFTASQYGFTEFPKVHGVEGPEMPESHRESSAPQRSWHLTDKHDFALDPEHHPANNTTWGGDWPHKGIFVGRPEEWFNGYDYVRPFVAEIEHPPLKSFGGYGSENFLPAKAFPRSRVVRVIPTDEWVRENYGEKGWFEDFEDPDPMMGPRTTFPNYRYQGPDVRKMPPEEIARHQQRVQDYIKAVRPHMLHEGADHVQWSSHEAEEARRSGSGAGAGRGALGGAEGAEGGSGPAPVRVRQSQGLAQGDGEAPLDPRFPAVEDATAIHDQSILDHGQPHAPLLDQGKLEGALGRAQNHYYYGTGTHGERMADAAGALAHGIGMSQAFEDGNKRTAYHTARYFLNANDFGHVSPVDHDDEELADHLIGHGEGTHSLQDTQALFRSRLGGSRSANVLDPVQMTLDPRVWEDPDQPEPHLKPEHRQWIIDTVYGILDEAGYDGAEKWGTLYLTGSLTTYQYSDQSDVDVSLFVDTKSFPEWSRAEMIGLFIERCDGMLMPGTPHELQTYVVAKGIEPSDLYKKGLRSGYNVLTDAWFVPPQPELAHDAEHEENEAYTQALIDADKMERLLRYEPTKAVMLYKQIHRRRMRDQKAGKGDFAPSNLSYKMLDNRGLLKRVMDLEKSQRAGS